MELHRGACLVEELVHRPHSSGASHSVPQGGRAGQTNFASCVAALISRAQYSPGPGTIEHVEKFTSGLFQTLHRARGMRNSSETCHRHTAVKGSRLQPQVWAPWQAEGGGEDLGWGAQPASPWPRPRSAGVLQRRRGASAAWCRAESPCSVGKLKGSGGRSRRPAGGG